MEENRKEIVSDAFIYNTLGNTLTLKGKQMDEYTHIHSLSLSLFFTHTLTHAHRESMLFL